MKKVLWNSTISKESIDFYIKKPFQTLIKMKENEGIKKWGGFIDEFSTFLQEAA